MSLNDEDVRGNDFSAETFIIKIRQKENINIT